MEPPYLYDILLVFILSATLAPLSTTAIILGLGPMKFQHSVTMSQTNLTEFQPKNWPSNLTSIDLSGKNLAGKIPTSIGNLLHLQNLSLASNSLTGPIPDFMSAMHELVHIDLSSNQLSGTVPKFIAEIKNLKFLNLEKNKFNGVLPFNESLISRLVVFKIGRNHDLCYNHTTVSQDMKLGISPCDKYGLPIAKPMAKYSLNDCDCDDTDVKPLKRHEHKHPRQVVLALAIVLSCVFFVIIILVVLSKCKG
ncbi:receptor-like protein 51 [Heracleum sosnowskyi]|uniref:Receptor-like protein 51 n=1 Tax=Heracleum sosnowskyi TaxID=360622 RepID=A0AAD8MRB3_9APIA|nr:receptor-like protein 51 [Heracleum sosnowskyi]